MEITPELEEKIREAFNRAPVNGSYSTTWQEEGKEAFQDGMFTILDLLKVEVKGINRQES